MYGTQKEMIMWIDVRIPFSEDSQLAEAYNRALENTTADWVLILDHDVFLANPRWYEMCLRAIENVKSDPTVACITCEANPKRPLSHYRHNKKIIEDINDHIEISKRYYKQHGDDLIEMDRYATGFFMLLNRKVAQEIGFQQMNKGISKIDVDFGTRLREQGYKVYKMLGLYVFHRRGMKHLFKEFTR